MRHIFLFLAISILSLKSTNAQIKELGSTISRDNPDSYYIVGKEGDSTLITLNLAKENRFTSEHSFHILPGEGRVKDQTGTKEKNKLYLLNKSRDTLVTVRKKSNKIEFSDGSFLTKQETDDGWNFVDADSKIVYELDLLWNKSKYKYDIRIYDNHENIVALNKFVTMSLYDMARYKSFEEDECDDDFWFIMYLAAL